MQVLGCPQSAQCILNRRLQQRSSCVSGRKTCALALERGELLRRARPIGIEAGRAALGELAPADRIGGGAAQRRRRVDAIDPGAAQAEDLALELSRQARIAVAL